ncbi:MAG TPA: DUF1326 domain-containing protein [Steroidobacteraceae bacterium]|nr:DUF1326 domain-containing protein [Steroidobacteraceae bacterium]
MALVEWSIEGTEFANCNCYVGCPCQFNALPSHGHCRAHTFVQVDKGHFGKVKLDGLRWGIFGMWPGPIHLGNGTFQAVIDERADTEQRAALDAIAHGRETEPGTLIWNVFAAMVSKNLPTLYKRIDLKIDVKKGTALVTVPGLIDSTASPIANPVTGNPHRVHVSLPTGFEFSEAEFTAGKAQTQGDIDLRFDNTHAHLAQIHWSTHGVVR